MFALRDLRLLLRLIRDFDLVNLVITGSFVIAAFYGKQSLFEVFMQLCVEWHMKILQLLKESCYPKQVYVLGFTQLLYFISTKKKKLEATYTRSFIHWVKQKLCFLKRQ